MIFRRGLHWLALATLIASGCDKTLSFDPPLSADGGDPGTGGISGAAGNGFGGFGGTMVGDAGQNEPWGRAGSVSTDPPPATGGGAGFVGEYDCVTHCTNNGLRCHTNQQRCVECLRHEDCPGDLYCDKNLNRCVNCIAGDGCPNGKECDWTHQCLERCLTESHPERECRDATQTCNEDRNLCLTCRNHEDCEFSQAGPYCLQGGARCASCADDDHCGREAPHCDPIEFRCVECVDSRDCYHPYLCDPYLHVCFDGRYGGPFPT
jgi:hypothetical protein